ncbi:MAG: 4-hydroxy-tetrahydrodipicolinate reductase [Lachnospiraceae bacterium]|nr:4-hydroxy-tetrahydrodipicolinate reductase [Lachnospiraceae bacterium]
MTRIILHGCMGQMGRVVSELAASLDDLEIVAGVDQRREADLPAYPVYERIRDCREEADAVVDFSVAAAVDALLEDCVQKKLPLVLCTTGLSRAQLDALDAAAGEIPVLKSANMSLGINLLLRLVRDAAGALKDAGFDIEIVEKHHRRKLDAPSGTAIALADSVSKGLTGDHPYVFDRSTRKEQRPKEEIGISAVRGGTIVGEHDVIFAGTDEVITLSHSAYSRAIFAKGAIAAAHFLKGKRAGYYDMSDVIGS